MPAKSIDPLKKVTIDLFLLDVDYLRANTENFSEVIRNLVRNHVVMMKADRKRKTLGDLQKEGYVKAEASWPKTSTLMRPK